MHLQSLEDVRAECTEMFLENSALKAALRLPAAGEGGEPGSAERPHAGASVADAEARRLRGEVARLEAALARMRDEAETERTRTGALERAAEADREVARGAQGRAERAERRLREALERGAGAAEGSVAAASASRRDAGVQKGGGAVDAVAQTQTDATTAVTQPMPTAAGATPVRSSRPGHAGSSATNTATPRGSEGPSASRPSAAEAPTAVPEVERLRLVLQATLREVKELQDECGALRARVAAAEAGKGGARGGAFAGSSMGAGVQERGVAGGDAGYGTPASSAVESRGTPVGTPRGELEGSGPAGAGAGAEFGTGRSVGVATEMGTGRSVGTATEFGTGASAMATEGVTSRALAAALAELGDTRRLLEDAMEDLAKTEAELAACKVEREDLRVQLREVEAELQEMRRKREEGDDDGNGALVSITKEEHDECEVTMALGGAVKHSTWHGWSWHGDDDDGATYAADATCVVR